MDTIGTYNDTQLARAGIAPETAAHLMAARNPPCRLARPEEPTIGTFAHLVIVAPKGRGKARVANVQAMRL